MMYSTKKIHRRTLLLSGIAQAGLSPVRSPYRSAFAPLGVRPAQAAGRGPSRLLLVFHPNGLESGWQPQSSQDLGRRLKILEPWRDRLLIVDGIAGGIRNEILAHSEGMTSLWTGSQVNELLEFAAHPSIDQIAAERISSGTPFRSIEFGVQTKESGQLSNTNVMCYSKTGQSMPAEDNPNALFQRLFGLTQNPADLQAKTRRQKSVLDLGRSQLERLRATLGTEERSRLDAHSEAIWAVEKRLEGLTRNSCEAAFTGLSGAETEISSNSSLFPEIAKLQTELVTMVLSCDLTRVASLQLSHSLSETKLPGVNQNHGIHTVMHNRPKSEREAINAWFLEEFARLLARLDAESLADGRSLLDDTLVVWGTEMAIGNHVNDPIPFIIAGGQGSEHLASGRYVKLENNPRHTQLLISVLHAFGIDDVFSLGEFKGERDIGPLEVVRA